MGSFNPSQKKTHTHKDKKKSASPEPSPNQQHHQPVHLKIYRWGRMHAKRGRIGSRGEGGCSRSASVKGGLNCILHRRRTRQARGFAGRTSVLAKAIGGGCPAEGCRGARVAQRKSEY